MPQNMQRHRISFLRKIVTVVFLPAIIFLWMTGWFLTQIGTQSRPLEIRQKTTPVQPKYETLREKKEQTEEDSSIAFESEIRA